MSSIISSHTKRLLRPRTTEYGCNSRTRENCPLQNQCLTPNRLYRADVENNAVKENKMYFDLAETSFKARFANHKQKSADLSKYIWSLRKDQIMSRIRWSIVEKVYGRTRIKFCPRCLAEKVHLIEHFNDNRLLNKMNEFISVCRH